MLGWLKRGKTRKAPAHYSPSWGASDPPAGVLAAMAGGARREPGVSELLRGLIETAYACAIINASAAASTPLRLYVRTGTGMRKCRWPHRSIGKFSRPGSLVRKIAAANESVDEVTEHPLLDLLDNPGLHLSRYSLLELIGLHLDSAGEAFLRAAGDPGRLGAPGRLTVITPSAVTLIPKLIDVDDLESNSVLKFNVGGGDFLPRAYDPDGLLWIKHVDPSRPYDRGRSPLRAAWESAEISRKQRSYEGDTLENRARPDVVIAAKDGALPVGREALKQLIAKYTSIFRRGGNGGAVGVEDAVTITPLNWSPKDLAELEIRQVSKAELANAFCVPLALLDTKDSNKAVAEAALDQHARQAVRPRCRKIADGLLPLARSYDERFFLEFDDPVPRDRAALREDVKAFVPAGVWSQDEARGEIGYEPKPNGMGEFKEPEPAPAPGMPPGKSEFGASKDDQPKKGGPRSAPQPGFQAWDY